MSQPPPPPWMPQTAETARWRDGLTLVQRLVVFLAVLGVVAGIALILVPLPVAPNGGTCGPGASSDSALIVKVNPQSVNEGSTAPAAYQQAFSEYCDGVANDRLTLAAVIAGASVAIGAAGAWLFGSHRRRAG